MSEDDSRITDRRASAMRVRLKYGDVDTFIQKYAVNISRGGIFIATKAPKAVGTIVRFEFLLSTSESLIRGEGVVQWIKELDPASPKSAGMGVKFTQLDAESQSIIDRALKWRAEHPPRTPSSAPNNDVEASAPSEPQATTGSAPIVESMPIEDNDFAESPPTAMATAPDVIEAVGDQGISDTELDELARGWNLSRAKIDEKISAGGRAPDDLDRALEALKHREAEREPTIAEASAQLSALLRD